MQRRSTASRVKRWKWDKSCLNNHAPCTERADIERSSACSSISVHARCTHECERQRTLSDRCEFYGWRQRGECRRRDPAQTSAPICQPTERNSDVGPSLLWNINWHILPNDRWIKFLAKTVTGSRNYSPKYWSGLSRLAFIEFSCENFTKSMCLTWQRRRLRA